MLTLELAREHFRYDPETGDLFRLKCSRRTDLIGVPVRCKSSDGYYRLMLKGRSYRAHRFAFFWMTGRWPVPDCDHINMIKTDNRWANLREATRSENKANVALSKRNKSGYKGVSWYEPTKRWVSKIKRNGKKYHLGYFRSAQEAHSAYVRKAQELFGEFANGG